MPNVPNSTNFNLRNVYDSVYGHAAGTATNLSSCFSNANPAYFDPTYNQVSYAPANSMKRFRNYTPSSGPPATVSMSVTYLSNPSVGVYNYTGTLTVVAPQSMTVSVGFELDFLTGSVPAGQSEAREANLTISSTQYNKTGAGNITTYSNSYGVGTTNIAFSLTFKNDNWNSPRPSSSFRMRLTADTNAVLSVANSTVTNGTTYVYTVLGVTTTFITISPTYSATTLSGHMIYHGISRNSGPTYTASSGYKPSQVEETWYTSSYDTNKKFMYTPFNGAGPYENTMPSEYLHGSNSVSTIDMLTQTSYYSRYTLLNHGASNTNYNYILSPYKYCSFTTINYNQSIQPLVPGGHILSLYQFSGNGDYMPKDLSIIPGKNTLYSNETFSYKYRIHCPTGGYINFYTAGDGMPLYDGDEYIIKTSINNDWRFSSVGNTSSRAKTTIGIDGVSRDGRTVIFQQTDQWVEILPVSSNVVVNSNFPNKFGYYGII